MPSVFKDIYLFIQDSTKFRQDLGGPENLFQTLTYFTDGRTDLPREAIGPEGMNSFSGTVHISIATCDLPGVGWGGRGLGGGVGVSGPLSPLWMLFDDISICLSITG